MIERIQKMDAEEFLGSFSAFLSNLNSNETIAYWQYLGPTKQSFGTPAGAWDSERFIGYRFKHLKEKFEFIIRPVPDYTYLVIESVSTGGQLANMDLSKSSKYKVVDDRVKIREDYTMTVGLGRRRVNEVRAEFKAMGMNDEGLISIFPAKNPDFDKILLDILAWAMIRERVKKSIQKKKSKEVKSDDNASESEKVEQSTEQFDTNYSPYRHVTSSEMNPTIGVEELSQEMAKFISNLEGDAPMQIGIFGRWGRGKTFLFDQIWKKLKGENKFQRVDFHAWKHQETPASWGYLYQAFAEKYYAGASWFGARIWRTVKLNWRREGKNEAAAFLIAVVGSLVVYFYRDSLTNYIHYIIGALGISFLYGVLKVFQRQSSKARELYRKFAKRHSYIELLGLQAEIQKELRSLLLTWLKKNKNGETSQRILLFVDDLDRCSEDRIIQVVDALRVMLEDSEIASRVIVVVAVDERILRRAIRLKYESLVEHEADQKEEKLLQLTREYLDKLFLTGIKLGELNANERVSIFSALTNRKVESMMDLEKRIKEQTGVWPIPASEEEMDQNTAQKEEIFEEPGVDLEYVGRNPNYEISIDEDSVLKEMVAELTSLTPRQIRILYLRYIFLRTFLTTFNPALEWNKEESFAAVQFIKTLHGEDLFSRSVQEVVLEELKSSDVHLKEFWEKLSDQRKEQYLNALQMVVPY